ncbi:MAG TPA: hypothetical protein DCW68_01480 [Rhodospirillaceae bacterium]|nr:MAG: hypothetical protein A2018_04445 [Alphaproteobacteria bacterium GWF2_58_20]HAU28769.1 hypothetical protein [Rhodospirillaceae bacterium]
MNTIQDAASSKSQVHVTDLPHPPHEPEKDDIRKILGTIWRRRGLISSITVLLTFLTYGLTSQLTPLYRAESQMLIEAGKVNVLDVETIISGGRTDSEAIRSEVEVLRSRRVAEKVIDKLGLMSDSEFNKALSPKKGIMSRFSLFSWLKSPPSEVSEDILAEQQRTQVVDTFLNHLSVDPIRNARVVRIAFVSKSSDTASKAANGVADAYLERQLEARFETTQRAAEWLNDRLGDLKVQVETSARAVEEYRQQHGILEGTDAPLNIQEMTQINSQLILSRAERSSTQARLNKINELLAADKPLETAKEVQESRIIQDLRIKEGELRRKVAELSTRYGPRHPSILNVNAELSDIERNINVEVGKIVANLKNELEIAKTRETSLESSLKDAESKTTTQNRARVELRALQSEADANRTVYEAFLNRFKQASSQEDLSLQDAQIISTAPHPLHPFFPNMPVIMLLAIILSFGLGVALALLLEYFDRGFRSMEQVEQFTGLSALGLIPELMNLGKDETPQDYVVGNPISAYGEAIRTVRTAVLLSNLDHPAKIVAITSTTPQEGKTSFASSLACVTAMSGSRAILIDCDMRRPAVHKSMHTENRDGLVELLLGEKQFSDIIQKDEKSGLHFITAGKSVPNPADLLASQHMRNLLRALSQQYDLVVLDCPPVLAVADPRVITLFADKTIFITRWAETNREVVAMAIRQLKDAGTNIAGIALSRVNMKRHSSYHYSDSVYYHGNYRKYYSYAE